MQKGRSDLTKSGWRYRACSRASCGKGEGKRVLVSALLAVFLLAGLVGWPDYSPAVDGTLQWAYITGDWVGSFPAIASDGTIYVGSYDYNLYALYGDSSLASTPWPMFHHDLKHTGIIR